MACKLAELFHRREAWECRRRDRKRHNAARDYHHGVSGFTLVEMLIVVGIVVILIGLLLPALRLARDQASTIGCLSNLRQMSMANIQYATENSGYNVPLCYVGLLGGTPATSYYTHDTWEAILMNGGYLPSAQTKSGAYHLFTPLRCPAGIDDTSKTPPGGWGLHAPNDGNGLYPHTSYYYLLAGSASNNFTQSWYGANGLVGDDQPEDADNYPSTLVPNFPLRSYPTPIYSGGNVLPGTAFGMPKINQVKLASEVAFAFDSGGAALNIGGQSPVTSNCFAARHKDASACNVAFFDGHAETLPDGLKRGVDSVFPLNVNGSYWDGGLGTYVWSVKGLNKNSSFPKWRLDQ